DPFPAGHPTSLREGGTAGVEAALSGSANTTETVIHSCWDAVGNNASRSHRAFEIRDTMSPTISFSHEILTVVQGTTYVEPDATCIDPPRGTFPTTNTGQRVNPDEIGTYTESYTCDDGLTLPSVWTREVGVVEPATTSPAIDPPGDETAYVRHASAYKSPTTCMEGGDDRTAEIRFDPRLETLEDEGDYKTTLYCPALSGDPDDYANKTVQITVDRTGPLANIDGVRPAVHHQQGTAYAYRDIMCIQDTGSPVRELADVAYVDAQNRTLDEGITAETPAGDYSVIFRCIDAANNHGQQYGVRLFIYDANPMFRQDGGSESVLNGTIAGEVHIRYPSGLKHDLECRPDGRGTGVDNDRLVFDPEIATVPINEPTEVRALCLDDQGRAGPHSIQTTTVRIDTILPGIGDVPMGASYFERGPLGPVSSGVLHPRYVGSVLQSDVDIRDDLLCYDSVDGKDENSVRVGTEFAITTKPFDHLPLGGKLTPQFIADHTDPDGNAKFRVVDVTCRDLANNTQSYSWILARDRPYHPVEGQRAQFFPVIDIKKMVTEVEAGPYYTPEGVITCTDYLTTRFSPNTAGLGNFEPLTEFRPGINIIPHRCTDAASLNVTTATYAFVPQDGGPILSITGGGSSVPAGEPIPVRATCSATDGSAPDVSNRTFSRFFSRAESRGFEQDPSDPTLERHFHVVFDCTDPQGRTAWGSATFIQTPTGPRIDLKEFEADRGRQTPRSAIANFHIVGTGYVDPGALCVDAAAGTSSEISGMAAPGGRLPDETTAGGAWTRVVYECTAGDATTEKTRWVRTMASKEITFDEGTTTHVGGSPFIDDATCTDTRGNLIADPPVVITGPGGRVGSIDGSVPGSYTIEYDCSDPRVLKGIGGLQHLKQFVLRPDEPFRKTVEVSPSPTSPVITIEGDPTINVIPGEPYAEPGFACTDRPGGEPITDTDRLTANFTAGEIIPNKETIIAYTCVDPDGEEADPAYRTL
ncbi:MAG: hypothetical protein MPJ07_08470, partial [Nitrosopumilus sp.]|nr:hypothetical protein [Nitrosopumilus sp.]